MQLLQFLTSNHALFLTRKDIFSASTWVLNLTVSLEGRLLIHDHAKNISSHISDAFEEKFGFLYEDMKVRNATSASNKIMQKMCTTFTNRAWGLDHIICQPTV